VAGTLTAVAELAAHYAPYTWFALVWTVPMAVLCAAGAVLIGRDRAHERVPAGLGVPVHRPRPITFAAAATALAAFVIVYSFLIPYHEDLVGLDLSSVTARRFVAVPIWPASGRFFPLALQEYNLLALFGRSAAVYHAFSVAELVVVLICCVRILEDVPGWLRCAALMFMMVLPSFVVAFFGIVYPERDMIVWLALWLVCLLAFDRTGSRAAFCGAVVAAQCLVYYKETAFILIGGFAGARLAMGMYRERDLLRRKALGRFASGHLLELAHLAICVLFAAVYYAAIARHVTSTYASAAFTPNAMQNALATYAGSDWVLDALAVVVLARLAGAAARRRALDPLWDAAALGALAYALAFVKLGLSREYYLAPVDFVGTLYLARLAYAGLFAQPRRMAWIAATVLGWLFQGNVRDAAHRLVTRKRYVQGTVRLAAFLRSYAASHGGSPLQLYFPSVGGFELMELSSYLQLKGFVPASADTATARGPSFVIKTPHRYPDDRCLAAEAFRCTFAPAPRPGDLVVLLAGRDLPKRALDSLEAAGTEVFHYRPDGAGLERVLQLVARRNDLADRSPDVRVFDLWGVACLGASSRRRASGG
jgi:hypothetical protein